MKNVALFSVVTFVCLMLFGCAAPSMYYWGKYSSSLYAYKKNPNDSTLAGYKKSLEDIIEESPKKNLRVPPGVYCEYGYLFAKEGHGVEAVKYFDLEKATYPESAFFIDKMKSRGTNKTDTSSAKKE